MNHQQKKQIVNQIFSDTGGRQLFPATLAQFTALDGILFNIICRSIDLHAGLIATRFKSLPTTVNPKGCRLQFH